VEVVVEEVEVVEGVVEAIKA